jgi:hypothetical protein
MSRIGSLSALLAGACALLATPRPAAAEDLYHAAADLRAKFAAELEDLAARCERRGLAEQAQKTRAVLVPQDPYKLYLPVLPEEVGPRPLPADAPAEVVQWDARLTRLRHDQAWALYEMARRAIRTHRPSLAYELVLSAIHADPDFDAARRILGYQKYRNGWYTPYEVRKLRAGQVWHQQFGWLPKASVRRWEEGLRPGDNRWIPAAEDAKAHRAIEAGWDVETEHYTIRTNHSIPSGVALGVKLERLYRIWQQMFICYYASEATVVALFDGRARAQTVEPRLSVFYFRDQEDYNRSLQAVQPNIGITTGLYLANARRAYFFAGQQADDRNLYHEATHQLFHQSRPVAPDVGRRANFWIVEGIAMYMESLRREGDYDVLGGLDDLRMQAARSRLLEKNFYVPLAELTSYGIERVQQDQHIPMLYSQSAGLTHFLVCYDNGRYRDALVAYLAAVYSGRDDANTLAQLAATSYAELDKQYRQFLEIAAKKAPRGE